MPRLLYGLSWLRSLLFTIPLIFFSTIVMGLVSLAVSPFDPAGRLQHALARLWARQLLLVSLARVRVEGLANLAPGGQYVFIINHSSYLDIPIVFASLPVEFRILAKASLFPLPFLGWHLGRTGHLPVGGRDPHTRGLRVRQAVRFLRQGKSLAVFAEGGRSKSGALGEFKPGIFLAAVKAGVPVVPVTLAGSRALQPLDTWIIRPGRAAFILDAPIPTQGLRCQDLDALIARVRARIEEILRGAGGGTGRDPSSAQADSG